MTEKARFQPMLMLLRGVECLVDTPLFAGGVIAVILIVATLYERKIEEQVYRARLIRPDGVVHKTIEVVSRGRPVSEGYWSGHTVLKSSRGHVGVAPVGWLWEVDGKDVFQELQRGTNASESTVSVDD